MCQESKHCSKKQQQQQQQAKTPVFRLEARMFPIRAVAAWQSSGLSHYCLLFNHRTQHLLEIELDTAQLQAIFI